MLAYVLDFLHETGVEDLQEENFDNIHELFAAILVIGINKQLKQGLHRDYVQQEEALASLRGQIRIAETIKQQTQIRGKLVCVFDEYTEDSQHNRILKSVMQLLLRHGDVKKSRSDLLKLLMHFANVTEINPTAIRWDSLKYHRNNASYRILIAICRFVIEGLLIQTEKADVYELRSWLNDGKMYKLYQDFILAYYKRHYPDLSPNPDTVEWHITNNAHSTYLPKMKTDITLHQKNTNKKLIIETKFYKQIMQTHHYAETLTYRSDHLYQIFAYVMNSSKSANGNVAGVLLYAKTDEPNIPVMDPLKFCDNPIWVEVLDLNQKFENISSQLDKICEEWLGPLQRVD